MTAKHVLLCLDTLVVPQTSENAFRSVFTLNCTGFPADRREVDRADRTLLFASSFSENEKVVKTCFLLRVVYQLAVERSANTSLTQRSEALKCYLQK